MKVVMIRQLEAVYENGVLRPLEPLVLVESQHVRITISDELPANPLLDVTVLLKARAEVGRLDHVPTIEDVRSALSAIPGNMSEVVIEERGDY